MDLEINVCVVGSNIDESKRDKQCLNAIYNRVIDLEKKIKKFYYHILINNEYKNEDTIYNEYYVKIDGILIAQEQQFKDISYLHKYDELLKLYMDNPNLNIQALIDTYDEWDKTITFKDYIIKLHEDKPHLFV